MEELQGSHQQRNLKMATEDYYKKQAEFYRSSAAYGKMTRLYPVLQSSINDCRGESLIN